MPQLVSLFNAVGGGAAALLAVHELINVVDPSLVGVQTSLTAGLDIVIGGVTFTGSLVAAGKLQGLVSGAPVVFAGVPAGQRAAGTDVPGRDRLDHRATRRVCRHCC